MAVHFNLPGHNIDDLSIIVIEQIWKDNIWRCHLRETHWIETLETVHPNDMNLDPGYICVNSTTYGTLDFVYLRFTYGTIALTVNIQHLRKAAYIAEPLRSSITTECNRRRSPLFRQRQI